MAIKMQQRRGTAAEWTSANPTLAAGEIGFETDTNKFKIGDGSTIWSALKYYATATDLEADIAATSPIVWTANPPGVSGTQATISFNQSAQNDTNDVRYVKLTGGATNVITSPDINSVPLTINAIGSQAVNLQNWKVDTVTKASIDQNGNIVTVGGVTANSGTASVLKLRIDPTGGNEEVSESSTNHSFQIGSSTGPNLRMDLNEVHAVNNGAFTTLKLQETGGDLSIAGTTGTTTVNGPLVTATVGPTGPAPLKIPAGTWLSTPAAQVFEATSDGIYLTSNPGSNTTGTGRGLITAPQMVFSLANSTAATTNTAVAAFATANDVLSVLEPAKLYRFSGKYYVASTFTSGTANIQTLFGFSNAPTAIKYNYKTYNQTAVTTTMAAVGTGSAVSGIQVSPSVTATVSYVIEFDGYFTTHASSTSTLTPQFQMSTTGSSTVVTAGSYFQVEKLGTSTTTLISGNWA
jgi:hypothetical protein